MKYTRGELSRICRQWGAKDNARCVSSIELAVEFGMKPEDVLRSLRKWQPNLFRKVKP